MKALSLLLLPSASHFSSLGLSFPMCQISKSLPHSSSCEAQKKVGKCGQVLGVITLTRVTVRALAGRGELLAFFFFFFFGHFEVLGIMRSAPQSQISSWARFTLWWEPEFLMPCGWLGRGDKEEIPGRSAHFRCLGSFSVTFRKA
jgi:hypothetical protein